jgi:hypothetical protein
MVDSKSKLDTCIIGHCYEVIFRAECLKRGMTVLVPEGNYLPFDCVIYHNNRFLRVQIKGSSSLRERHRTNKGWSKVYETSVPRKQYSETVDMIAFYIQPCNTWYIIPNNAVTGNRIKVNPHGENRGKYSKFSNRWDLLTTPEIDCNTKFL